MFMTPLSLDSRVNRLILTLFGVVVVVLRCISSFGLLMVVGLTVLYGAVACVHVPTFVSYTLAVWLAYPLCCAVQR